MLIETYLAVFATAVLFAVLSFYRPASIEKLDSVVGDSELREKNYNLVFPWMAFIMFMALAVSSPVIEYQHCERSVDYINKTNNVSNYTYQPWNCATYSNEEVPLTYLNMGLGLIMFIVAMVQTIDLFPAVLGGGRRGGL